MKKKINTNIIGILLLLASFVFLIPGLVEPLITLSGSAKFLVIKKELFRDTRSILQTVGNLSESGNYLVAGLILFFSVLVPFIKGLLLLAIFRLKDVKRRERIFRFVRGISKWAMADVFVAAIFIAFLGSRATRNMDASIEPGFYFFTVYCILSLLSLQFLKVPPGASRAKS
jgi:paraquat-inducible protein A